jgi:hypothetical protein
MYRLIFEQYLIGLKRNNFHYKNEKILDKSVFFNQININFYDGISFIYVGNCTSNDIIKHNIFYKNVIRNINIYSISSTFLFNCNDNIENILFNGKLNCFIFDSELNHDEIEAGNNLLFSSNTRIYSASKDQITSLIGKFYNNNILLYNSYLINKEIDESEMIYTSGYDSPY